MRKSAMNENKTRHEATAGPRPGSEARTRARSTGSGDEPRPRGNRLSSKALLAKLKGATRDQVRTASTDFSTGHAEKETGTSMANRKRKKNKKR